MDDPVVLIDLGGQSNADVTADVQTVTNFAQRRVAETTAGVYTVETSDLALIGAHFTGNGYAELGNRLGDLIADVLLGGGMNRFGVGARTGLRVGLGG